MKPTIERIDDKIYYSIEELEIEIELSEKFATVEPCYFTDPDSEEYWDANWERIVEETMNWIADEEYEEKSNQIDFSRDQPLLSIRSNGQELGYIEAKGGKLVTSGQIGENTYENFVDLIKGLRGHGIKIDDFYT